MSPTDITSEAEFEQELEKLYRRALHSGIDPRGIWVTRNGSEAPEFETEVVELAKRD